MNIAKQIYSFINDQSGAFMSMSKLVPKNYLNLEQFVLTNFSSVPENPFNCLSPKRNPLLWDSEGLLPACLIVEGGEE